MLSRAELLLQLTDYLETMFETPRERATEDARLVEDLDLDSIDIVDLVVKLRVSALNTNVRLVGQ